VVGHAAQSQQVGGLEQQESVVAVEAATRSNLVPDGMQPLVAEAQFDTSRVDSREIISSAPDSVEVFPAVEPRSAIAWPFSSDNERPTSDVDTRPAVC
jgi:hypothetical protein